MRGACFGAVDTSGLAADGSGLAPFLPPFLLWRRYVLTIMQGCPGEDKAEVRWLTGSFRRLIRHR